MSFLVTTASAQDHAPVADPNVPPVESGAAGLHGETVQVEHGEGGFPPMSTEFFPSQLLWLAITFGIFYLVMKRLVLPRIGGTIENRRDRIALDLNAAEQMRAEADAAQAAYEQELAEARDRSHKTVLQTRDEIRATSEAERARLEGELNTRLDEAQARVAEIKTRALADVGTIAEEAAETILKAVAGLDVSRQDVAAAVQSVRS
ncbi:F0F1 ATP synthase subunit B [Aurantimonas sp. Leaf443]|uniref:F0F1 ATP synthase subunit B n=1 Tax=Aurantimonas sp. Leaf443 TaxID=1736378 RepID=UPI001FCE17DF|nr:F0F1 ATP synthase subunit B [Aurantimonas sp. Leaf443]